MQELLVTLTCLCPKSLRMVASFLVTACWCWPAAAGCGSLQSTDSRWSHMSACCTWGCLRPGSKQCTSQPDAARWRSRERSPTPSLQHHEAQWTRRLSDSELRFFSSTTGRWFSVSLFWPACANWRKWKSAFLCEAEVSKHFDWWTTMVSYNQSRGQSYSRWKTYISQVK